MMNKVTVCTLTMLCSTVVGVGESDAATVAPPLFEQVQQVTDWFTGEFNNVEQVADNPLLPPITMSNCSVELLGGNFSENSEAVYLEQTTGGVPFRVRFYSFSPTDTQVNLSVQPFLDQSSLLGLCDRPASERVINFSNILNQSCDIGLSWQPGLYVGTNAPNGCLTASGGTVVSDVSISANEIDSLDQIFDQSGNLVFATPIEFRRAAAVDESSAHLGLLILGFWGISMSLVHRSSDLKRRVNSH